MASHHRNSPILFVGTYTEPEGSKSEGIYVYRMDSMTGQLTFEKVIKGIINPSFLDIHPQKNFLYAVNETESFNEQAGGGVSALSIDPTSDQLVLLNEQISHGRHPCYVSVEQTGRFAMAANYSSGSVAIFPIQSDGRLGAATDVVQHVGSSIHPERQTGPHAHCILPDPTNRFAIAVDLGLDKLLIYQLDLERGKLQFHHEVQVHAGAGPRHLTFDPNRQHAYLINELDSTITAYGYHSEDARFEEFQRVSALPENFQDENLCADIHVSLDGKYLYASNRGHDSIVCFLIDQSTRALTYVAHTSTGGREPRNFAIDPSGTFLLVANQKSDNIVTFKIDPDTGQLSKTEYQVEISMPVCIKFAHLSS
jgi:6-phosphogluconolactonase